MLAIHLPVAVSAPTSAPLVLASAPLLSPVLILLLCLFAGIATVFMLPGHREMTIRKVGGVLLIALGLIFAASRAKLVAGRSQ